MNILKFCLIGIVITILPFVFAESYNDEIFRAAVFDQQATFAPPTIEPLSREEALAIMQETLIKYEKQCEIANSQNVDIIVFAEYGIIPLGLSRDTIYPFLEQIIETDDTYIPCDDEITDNIEVQRSLSCMAKKYQLYLVANFGNVLSCDNSTSSSCPSDGRFQYNTNVVYNPLGQFIARYHKKELFFEYHYDVPEITDFTYFNTPFGRMGTFVCFDVVFEEPAVRLIEDYDIDTVVFPTAWMNVEPYYSAVPFHQSFAINMGVNFLSANLRFPLADFSGSAIVTPTQTLAYRNNYRTYTSDLLIADVPVKPTQIPYQWPSLEGLESADSDFTGIIFDDKYDFRILMPTSGEIVETSVCQNDLCCKLSYSVDAFADDEFYAMGAFRGLHIEEGTYYLEICTVMRCAGSTVDSCSEEPPRTANTLFNTLEMTGNFTGPYVHPQLVQDGMNANQTLWSWDGSTISAQLSSLDKGLVSSTLFSRRYDLDHM